MSAPNQNNNDEIGLLELFAIIWRGKWRIANPSLLIVLGQHYIRNQNLSEI
ncbi:hypothetical protein N9Y79_01765 [Alphaproteobacteria bacterium]|nr:hypothetical protein [Alphaproteobacteria bacterium]MDB2641253.1 hypothetical protein [Alphaproteobacteria bacterium]